MALFSFFRSKPQSKGSRAQRRRDADNRSLFEKTAAQLPSTSAAATQATPHIIAINPKAHQKLGTNYSHPIKPSPKSSKLSKKQQQQQSKPLPHPPRKSQISAPQQTPFAHPQQQQQRTSASLDPHHAYHSAVRQGYTPSYRQFQPIHPPPQRPVDSHNISYAHKPLPPIPSPPKAALLRTGKPVQSRHQHGALIAVVHPDHHHDSMRAEVGQGWKSKAQEASFRPLSEIGFAGREARGWAEREMGAYFDEEVRRGSGKGWLDG
ncbi:MAG: hypothetical protein OHK93_005274 [Ramalina farinacea]|uniref:Uncharacterized protein n=1 Tax=Ramalina farinacea TaxID=258253 RepID=A0AA43TZG6_9LECA|nr:hypothetical protein [Ramalina farinacea]